MRLLKKGLIGGLIVSGFAAVAGYSNPIDGGSSVTVTNDWDAGFQLTVGRSTAGNALIITNGGAVFDGVGVVGELSGANGNLVEVTGDGSSWTNVSDLAIGNGGSSNILLIENGGVVYNANGVVGVEEGSGNNSVWVSGTNSLWENADTLMVGRKGDNNSLVITNGGTVTSSFGAIGFESPAADNTVVVTGAGSTWNNSGDLLIGDAFSSGNSLTIQDGGKVIVGGQLDIFNDLNLNNGGWLEVAGHADLINSGFNYNSGSTLEVTGSVWFNGVVNDRNTLIFQGENATWLGGDIVHDLNVGGAGDDSLVIVSNKANIGVEDATFKSSGNRMVVTGAGSDFNVVSNLYIGVNGSDNEVRIEDSATASATYAYIGYEGATAGNRLVVDGLGASFTSSDTVSVGFDGSDSNRLELVNGGSAGLAAVLIGDTNAMHNLVLVDGSNSLFSAAELTIGNEESSYNRFTVLNGGQASSGTTLIGGGTNAHYNSAWVSGTNSYWDAGTLTIGSEVSMTNVLTIEDGGRVFASTLLIAETNNNGNALNLNQGGWLTVAGDMDALSAGFNWASWSTLEVQASLTMPGYTNIIGTSTNITGYHDGQNTLILSSGGIWSNANDVTVGVTNALNTLQLVDGGVIVSDYGFIGADSDSNLVTIAGGGSVWSNKLDFIVGTNGSDNTVFVTDQGKLSVYDDTLIGQQVGSTGNRVIVQGAGSRFFNGFGVVVVGDEGGSNEVQVLDGASVNSAGALLGSNSDGNSVLIDGEGTEWSNASGLAIGGAGSSNTFTVSNGAKTLVGGNAYLGVVSGSDGNLMALSGSNSYASISLNLHVGHGGSGNELRVLDGAKVFNDIGLLGTDNGSDNNSALISGDDSLWYNRHTFFAGNSGSSNSVVVQDGAILQNTTGYIGYHTNAVGNRVVVDNAEWLNDGGLFVGFNGSGNSLIITNGAEVTSGESRIGAEGFANDNLALVSGAGSVWNISRSLWVGNDTGTNNTLTVENGGRIVIDENISVGSNNWLNVLNGGTVTVYGDTLFTAGFNVGAGGTFETFGGVSGLGGVLESGRTLRLAGAGASWNEPDDILLESGSTLDIGAGAFVSTPSNYTQQASATIRFGIATNSSGGPITGYLNVGQYADFADGANFFYSSDIGSLSFDATYTNTLVAADTLVVGGQTNATTADLNQYLNTGGSLVGVSLFVQDQDILALINRISASDALDPASEDLRAVLAEIEDRALAGDPLANKQLGIINSLSTNQALAELTQFYTLGTPNYQHMDGVLLGLKQIEKRTSEMTLDTLYFTPTGAYGPAAASGAWRGWVSAYGNNGTRDSGGGYSGFDVGTYGTVLGVDKAFNNMVVGLSGGLAGSSISQEDGDTSDASTAYGALYATFSVKQVDWDVIGSYGSSSIESSSGTIFGSTAETDASTAVFYIGASEEQRYGQFTVTPMAAFQAALYSQEGYDEVSANAVGRSVDDYERWSYKSILGASLNAAKPYRSFDFLMRFKASWQHEFNTDIDTLNYSLIGGTDPHYFTIQAPVEDAIDLGVGLGALFNENLEFSVGLDALFSQDYLGVSYNGRVQYTF